MMELRTTSEKKKIAAGKDTVGYIIAMCITKSTAYYRTPWTVICSC